MRNITDVTMLNTPLSRNGKSFVVTDRGSLVAGIVLEGKDSTLASSEHHLMLTKVLRNILNPLPLDLVFTSYYISASGIKIKSENCDHPVAQRLSDKRIDFLNESDLKKTNIYHTVELIPDSAFFTAPASPSIIAAIAKAIFNKDARDFLKLKLSDKNALVFFKKELNRLHDSLSDIIEQIKDRYSICFDCEIMSTKEIWGLSRYLSTFDPRHLYLPDDPPSRAWANYIDNGDVVCVTAGDPPCAAMLNRGIVDRYIRYASAVTWTGESVPPATHYSKPESLLSRDIPLVYVIRWRPLNSLEQHSMMNDYKDEIARSNLKLSNIMQGRTSQDEQFVKRSTQRKLDELDEAENLTDRWGYSSTHIGFALTDPNRLREVSSKIDSACAAVGVKLVWESHAMPLVRSGLQPHLPQNRIREIPTSSTQFAALSPVYNDHIGKIYDSSLNMPALIVLTGKKNVPFWYHPYGPSNVVTLGVGPTGAGKSFFKNGLAVNFGKYRNSVYRAIDIDPGTESVAQIYGEDGNIFRVANTQIGFNPFRLLKTAGRDALAVRLKQLVIEQLSVNEAIEAREITIEEEKDLERNIGLLLSPSLTDDERTYPALVGQLTRSLRDKLGSFVDDGMYSRVWGTFDDAIGDLNVRYGVYNLEGIAKDDHLKKLVMSEIFWRCLIEFEDFKNAQIPMYLDIDEAQHILENPQWQSVIVNSGARRWRKLFNHIALWSQSPTDFSSINNWGAIKGAVGTFNFMADPKGDVDAYREGFGLVDGEIEAIQQLKPRSEVLIKQPSIGVSRVVRLLVDEEQYAMMTSQPIEAAKRREYIDKYGFEDGLRRTVDFIREQNAKGNESPDFNAVIAEVI